MAEQKKRNLKPYFLGLSFIVLIGVLLLPTPDDLPIMGHRALAVLAFAIILWVTEAVTYPVSAAMIVSLLTLLLGLSPKLDNPDELLTTKEALKMALGGFASPAVALVAGALFLAAAMQATNLHKRLALYILSKVGAKTGAIVFGAILVSIILAFFVPSATARAGAIVPILLGMVAAFGLPANSRLGALLIITAVQSISIWNVGIKTAAAQNMVALDFIYEQFGVDVSWGQWFIYAAPWSIIMSIVLYFVMINVIKPETKVLDGGTDIVRKNLKELGPLRAEEKRLIIISLALLFFWATEKRFHPFDSTTVTIVAVAILLLPKIGVFTWKQVEKLIPWGTIIVFAVGIALGSILLATDGAQWLSDKMFGMMGLDSMPLLATIALLALFNILIHLGFASATALASALIPIVLVLASTLGSDVNPVGFVLIQQFVISFGFLLPVNAPQNMLAYGTGSFTVKDFFKAGLPITIIGYILILIFSATYWKWIGLL
ncbi:MAG TPA: DASS family sodium-coupled anion symporter [Candidatus Avacidaminococcus intestinavium]|uniref:Sodium-dependent dicarboxylate transporter SdcS n=1 Tax=Candidatus Avacidaminococcus intestinavium TaxID=2840684 RepID=A0A9D1MPS0_9FIRM|nr:DASS family sodium-coupled anion symporter [Candidatus Avacidaminococcus intestinavium]